MKEKFVNFTVRFGLFFIAFLFLIALAVPLYASADLPDLKEKNSDDRAADDVYYTYSFFDSDLVDSGETLQDYYNLSLGYSFDLLVGNGNYVSFAPLSRSTYYDGYLNYQSVADFLLFSIYIYESNYTCLNLTLLAFDDGGPFLTFDYSGLIFYADSGVLIFDRIAFRFYDNAERNYVYFGCSDDDFVTSLALEDFEDYCLSFGNTDEYGSGLFGWIEYHFLPLFGDVPSDVLDMGIFGSWSVLQFIRVVMWISLGLVCCSAFVVLPYCIIKRLLGIKKRGVKK